MLLEESDGIGEVGSVGVYEAGFAWVSCKDRSGGGLKLVLTRN